MRRPGADCLASSSVTRLRRRVARLGQYPYFANYAAIGWLKDNQVNRVGDVEAWIGWYLRHLNQPDSLGVYGTAFNYTYDPSTGEQTSTEADVR